MAKHTYVRKDEHGNIAEKVTFASRKELADHLNRSEQAEKGQKLFGEAQQAAEDSGVADAAQRGFYTSGSRRTTSGLPEKGEPYSTERPTKGEPREKKSE